MSDDTLPSLNLERKEPDCRPIRRFLQPHRFKTWYGSTPGPAQSLVLEPGVDRSCEARPRTAVRALPMDAIACPRASFSTTRWQIRSRFANEPSLGLLEWTASWACVSYWWLANDRRWACCTLQFTRHDRILVFQ